MPTLIKGTLAVNTYCNNGDYSSFLFALMENSGEADLRLIVTKSGASHGYGVTPTVVLLDPSVDDVRAAVLEACQAIETCQGYRDWKWVTSVDKPMLDWLKTFKGLPKFKTQKKDDSLVWKYCTPDTPGLKVGEEDADEN